MKITINYTGGILNLPTKVTEFTNEATKEDLCFIINLFACPEYFGCFDSVIEGFSERTGLSENDILRSIAFWNKTGVITVEGMKHYAPAVSVSNKVPTYSGAQVKKIMEKNAEIASLFDICQTIMGKSFTPVDFNNIIYLKDYFKLSNEYIMLLISHCVENEKDGWAYIRKTAKNLYEDGIYTYTQLEKHFEDRKNRMSAEYKIRGIFGIGTRELSKKEEEKIHLWIKEAIPEELIKKAYDITVNNTGKISLAYASRIIENWISLGYKTLEDVESNDRKRIEKQSMSTFDADDFFEAALARSERIYEKARKEAKK